LEESVTVAQAREARVYGQLAMVLAWQWPELFSLAHGTALDKVVTYNSYFEEIIRKGKPNHSPREHRLLAAHYRQAQQLFSDYPENRLLKKVAYTAVDSPPLLAQRPSVHRSWIFDNGHYSLLVLFEGSSIVPISTTGNIFRYESRWPLRKLRVSRTLTSNGAVIVKRIPLTP
jgi:hypothetical protein